MVYFPYNYLSKDKYPGEKYEYHFADFAIFEVDFGNENVAKLFTRDFYGKYDREKGTKKNKALNLFAKPLNQQYSNQQLLEKNMQVWMAGYPAAGMSHKASTNYNLARKTSSKLIYWQSFTGQDGTRMYGTADMSYSNGKQRWK